ncbi:succinate dehydrogenase, cytochrome b556 subunit [Roseateles chitinivorans]|uniref:Succinate dehydrogenase cytochrome b556 subunit n=1 Tax=Roseateles chitinivorans TaxID=2917965 RepID=A0A2G9C3G3_9BURK|nr:succinate dehydrogenase, cytochrome b556 subunit [Roseateles chitinivorans]PIM50927.1 succinate dehydrogenase, cytochrome b556 subunit [Roseateles chitinivorans]
MSAMTHDLQGLSSMKKTTRPAHTNVGPAQLLAYMTRFPVTAWVSLLHRVSGLLLVLLLPLMVWGFDAALASETAYERMTAVFSTGWGFVPGWLVKLLLLLVLWAFLHHLAAGLRFVWLDLNHGAVEKRRASRSARWVLVVSVAVTLAVGAKAFALY